jgi:hypothetical protein
LALSQEAYSVLIEESKLGSDKFAQLVKDRAGQQITVRGQDIQARNNAAWSKHSSSNNAARQDITDRRERDLTLAENQAAAKARGKVMAENKVEAERALPGAIATAEQTLTLIDEMIGDARVSKDGKKWEVPKGGRDPAEGFTDYVGAWCSWRSDFWKVQTPHRMSVGSCRSKARPSWKRMSPCVVAVRLPRSKAPKVEQAISRMNKAQSEVEYVKAARELQEVVRKGVERARN